MAHECAGHREITILVSKELRWKIEHTLSNPPQATAVPAGENAAVMTQAQASLMA
jgi:hypothetical protein